MAAKVVRSMCDGALSRFVADVVCSLAIAAGAFAREGQVTATPPRPLEQASTAATPTGLILGRVVDATTNKPIPRAVVTLGGSGILRPVMGGGQGPQRVLTDSDGHFLFRDLAKGNYNFTAAAPGYLTGGYGQRRPEGRTQPFVLEDGQRVGDVVVRLWRESVISGTITDETGAPVTGVTVLINRRVMVGGRLELRPQQYGTRTNDRGVYSQAAIPPGEYVVTVPAGMTVTRAGQPAPDATATAALRASGADTLISGGQAARSSGVRLGDFFVLPGGVNSLAGQLPLTMLPSGRVVTYPTTFQPSATTLGAAGVIKLGVGEERTVDVQLQPVTTAPVSGTVVTPDGPAVNYAVHLIPDFAVHTPVERYFETAVTVTDQSGKFVFPAVAAGSYSALTWRKPSRNSSLTNALPAESALFAEAAVVIEDAPAMVALALRPGAMLRGRIVLEGATPPPRPQQFQAVLGSWFQPPWPLAFNAGPIAETRVTADWEFMREGVPPGRYTPNVLSNFSPPAGWFLKSATVEGRDLLTSPVFVDGKDVSGIVITFTDRPASVSGLVTDAAGRSDAAAGVLAFPLDYQSWLANGSPPAVARAVPAAQTGAFTIPDLPPGEYLVVAVGLEILDDWQPAMVKALAGHATRVTMANGTAARVDLRRR
jgi:Carboxypeptidase regulatory-like domain